MATAQQIAAALAGLKAARKAFRVQVKETIATQFGGDFVDEIAGGQKEASASLLGQLVEDAAPAAPAPKPAAAAPSSATPTSTTPDKPKTT